ncbi:MAG: hypothetical protein ACPL1K_04950, partial [Candidatus Kryptoniota bacterium]
MRVIKKRKLMVQLAIPISLWILLLALLPIVLSYGYLKKSEYWSAQGKLDIAAENLRMASWGLFWQRRELLELAGKYALLAEEPQLCTEILRPLYIEDHLSNQGKFLLAQAYQALGYTTVADQLKQELADGGYLSLIIYPTLLEDYFALHEVDRTEAVLAKLIQLQPEFLEWQYRQGLLFLVIQPREAISQLKLITIKEPKYSDQINRLLTPIEQTRVQNDAYLYLQAGRGLASIGEWILAEAAFAKAVSLRPDYAEAWAYLGLAKMHTVKKGDSFPNQTKPEGLLKGSRIDITMEDRDKPLERGGLAEIRHALWINPQSQVALAFETQYWLERGYPQQALRAARQAIRIYPSEEYNFEQYAQALIL